MAKKLQTVAEGEKLTLTFEQAYKELESIVAQLEAGELALEQTLELHTHGQKLAMHCAMLLDEAELKVKQVGD
jgi:exodeoxyribonuclease VII small subunit